MGGSACWDGRSLFPHIAGLQQCVSALKPCVVACSARNVALLTMFVFSAENWNRRAEEVSGLMDLLASSLVHEFDSLKSSGAQLHFIGDRWYLSARSPAALAQAEHTASDNQRQLLNVCLNDVDRWDIANALQALASNRHH